MLMLVEIVGRTWLSAGLGWTQQAWRAPSMGWSALHGLNLVLREA